jgi:E3 ubiquitin-protein ligase UBR4
MVPFSRFVKEIPDHQEPEKAYNDYQSEYNKRQIHLFFNAHKSDLWFQEKYHPTFIATRLENAISHATARSKRFIEGYDYLPDEILGIYVFSKRMAFVSNDSASKKDFGFVTVSNFNIIHLSCHNKAVLVDAEKKPKKEEWEGAFTRNASTKCNNVFPFWGPSINVETYATMVENYWSVLSGSCGRCDMSRFKLISHDLRFIFHRFAFELPFNEDSRGGNRESNIRLIPPFMKMGFYLLEHGSDKRSVNEQNLSGFLTSDHAAWFKPPKRERADNSEFYATLSLFLLSFVEWEKFKFLFLERLLLESFMEGIDVESEMPNDLFGASKKALVFFFMLDQVQQRIKSELPVPENLSDDSRVNHASNAPWITQLQENLRCKFDELDRVMISLLEPYEQAVLPCKSFQEFPSLNIPHDLTVENFVTNTWTQARELSKPKN